MKDADNIQITLTAIDDLAKQLSTIEQKWQALERSINNQNFFLSWSWMKVWLLYKPNDLYLLEGTINGRLIALAFIVESKNQKMTKQGCWLNKTGDLQLDQVWIEYNDFLLAPDVAKVARQKLLDFLFNNNQVRCQRLFFDMTMCTQLAGGQHFSSRQTLVTSGYKKVLSHVSDLDSLLLSLSKNTRQQIRRSLKLLEQSGPVQLDFINGSEQIVRAANTIAKLHINQWQDSEWGSGFNNPYFVSFHQHLMQTKQAEILELRHNDKALAYGYYFCFNKRVLFYLSAMTKHENNQIKIGLVMHILAMLKFAELGYDEYDFLAGDARYKRSLSDSSYDMVSYCLDKNNWLGKTERFFRTLKQKITNKVEQQSG